MSLVQVRQEANRRQVQPQLRLVIVQPTRAAVKRIQKDIIDLGKITQCVNMEERHVK